MKRKKFSEQAIEATAAFLKEKGFINDQDFTRLWIASRIKKPLGIRRIRQELRSKGIDADSIEQQFADLKETYSEEEVVREIVRRKMDALTRLAPLIAKRRLYAYLLRRGFSPDIVIEALSKIRCTDPLL